MMILGKTVQKNGRDIKRKKDDPQEGRSSMTWRIQESPQILVAA
jgi:hypothetical protein